MPTPTKKRPPMEREPGEGKAHEMKETPEEEVREGTESEEGEQYRKPSRKRSAKGAKRTKAPMDCEGCSGKTAGKCKACTSKAMKDGCGSYPMKKRSDALTAPEYLAACELGIQHKSRNYIRARLDTARRLDLKCGNGAIPEGKTCHKGPASRASLETAALQASKKPSSGLTTALTAAAVIGVSAAVGKVIQNKVKEQELINKERFRLALANRHSNSFTNRAYSQQTRERARAASARSARFPDDPTIQRESKHAQLALSSDQQRKTSSNNWTRSQLSEVASSAPLSPARQRKIQRSKGSMGVWAHGFNTAVSVMER